MADIVLKPATTPPSSKELDNGVDGHHKAGTGLTIGSPRDEPLTIDGFLRLRAKQMGNDPIVAYPSSGIEYVDYSPEQLNTFACRVAKHYSSLIPPRSSSAEAEVTVAILGPSNLEYLITLLALTKLGHTVLFLSTRLSTVAYVSLLWTTRAKHLLIDQSYRRAATSISSELSAVTVGEIASRDVFETDAPYSTSMADHLDPLVENTKIAWIIHSSGSTGLPKPIYQTHRAALKNYTNNMNMVGYITLPLYHAHGLSVLFRGLNARKKVMLYNANLPLAREYLLGVLRDHSEIEIFYAVPYALKILAESPEGIAALAKLKAVMSAGSACPDAVGDRLVAHGVNLVSHFGTTETGQLMTSARPNPDQDKDWNYLRAMPDVRTYLQWEPQGENIYELVVLDGLKSKVASNRPDGSYATKDLFTPHPTKPHAWKYYARLDDTITLVNGEKAVPNLFEHEIRTNPNVSEAIIFGAGKPCLGMMIIPSVVTEGFDDETILGSILPSLEKANKEAPAYAQISLEMVKILPKDTDLPKTDKGTVIRARFYKEFSTQIDAVYEATEVASGELALSEEELQTWLRKELAESMNLDPSDLDDNTDFFSIGVDSLRAIQIRSVIVRHIDTGGHKLSSNIAFDYPTIRSLAAHLFHLRTGNTNTASPIIEEQMTALISQHSTFKKHIPHPNPLTSQSVVVTGATGSLGAHIVAQLSLLPSITTIYCLVRGTPSNAQTRVLSSLRSRRLLHTLPLPSRRKIIALPSNLTLPDLGLSPTLYSQVTSNLTTIIHAAYPVNFSLSLSSFAPSLLSLHNLLTLSLSTRTPHPATFNFISSVSAVAAHPDTHATESLPPSLSSAQNMGYAQSKLVAEHICTTAALTTDMTVRVLRVGQVIGDTVHGIWPASEAIPLILQCALTIGAVPRLDEHPSWLPVDTVGRAVVEISLGEMRPAAGVVNVVNERTFHWTRDLLPMLRRALPPGTEYDEVGRLEWLAKLRGSSQDAVSNPPVKLGAFFEGKYGFPDGESRRRGMSYATERARECSPALAHAPVIDAAFVERCVGYWMSGPWKVGGRGYEDIVAGHLMGEHGIDLSRGRCSVFKSDIELMSRSDEAQLVPRRSISHHVTFPLSTIGAIGYVDESSISSQTVQVPLEEIVLFHEQEVDQGFHALKYSIERPKKAAPLIITSDQRQKLKFLIRLNASSFENIESSHPASPDFHVGGQQETDTVKLQPSPLV